MPLPLARLLVAAAVLTTHAHVHAGDAPPDLLALECSFHQLAFEHFSKLVPSSPQALHDALNLQNCSGLLDSAVLDANGRTLGAAPPVRGEVPRVGATTLYVATTGSDASGTGTTAAPFASLHGAQAAIRKLGSTRGSVTVSVRGGKYYFNETLALGATDSNVRWAAYQGEKVTLSGAKLLKPQWKPYKGDSGILMAPIPASEVTSEAERAYLADEGQRGASGYGYAAADPFSSDAEASACDSGLWENGTDFAGNDIKRGNAAAPADCCALCTKTAGCKAWTYNMAKGNEHSCYLKSSDAGRACMADHTSGRPGQQPAPTKCPPPPPPAPPAPPMPAHKWGPPPAQWNTLHVGGVRQVRARHPNGNPQDNTGICFSATNRPGEGCTAYMQAGGQAGKLPTAPDGAKITYPTNRGNSPTEGCAQCGKYGTFKYTIYNPLQGHPVYNKPLPGHGWKNNSLFSFWGSPLARAGGVKVQAADKLPQLAKPAGAVVHMFHGGLWGGWQYSVSQQDESSLYFGYGGYQEARGSNIGNNRYYVENALELLDTPGEWFYDAAGETLYLHPNSSNVDSYSEVAAPLLDSVVKVVGAHNVAFVGFDFTETRATYLDQYEVSSGGDWSVHRGAAFFIEDSSNISVSDSVFSQTGGNAIMFSNNVVDSSVVSNEFVFIGDSAILSLGSTDTIFGTAPTYPNRNLIEGNHIHEVGVYGKQTSCYFHSLAANITLKNNLCYNGPRAGINWNDGFGGNNLVEGNLVMNMVRETGDHGPYNSWDRQPYLTTSGVHDGFTPAQKMGSSASMIKQHDVITRNMFINGYNGVWSIDHDDGSQYFNDTANLMLWGGCKNYLGNSKSCDANVIVHPGISERSSGGRKCQTDDNSEFSNQYHGENHCFTQDGKFYSMGGWSKCDEADIKDHVYETFKNTLYSPNATFTAPGPCADFAAWQAAGQDVGSQVLPMPADADIVAMGKSLLDGQ